MDGITSNNDSPIEHSNQVAVNVLGTLGAVSLSLKPAISYQLTVLIILRSGLTTSSLNRSSQFIL